MRHGARFPGAQGLWPVDLVSASHCRARARLLRAENAAATAQIRRRQIRRLKAGLRSDRMEYFLQQLINGITLGSIYGLIAIGYTMVYGIIGMINFAHGDVFMVGAFIA